MKSRRISNRPQRRGMTLIEVMVSVVVLTVAAYLLSSTLTSTVVHTEGKREMTLASEAAQNMIELMRARPFEEVYAHFNHDPGDDPEGSGSSPGPWFDVAGLEPIGGAEGPAQVGEILLPGPGPTLLETQDLPELGLPRDLNGDTRVDQKDHAEDYMVLPVTVRLRWRGATGKRQLRMSTMLALLERHEEP